MNNWDEMKYWNSGEWQVVQEKLDDLEKSKIAYFPLRQNLFAALDAVEQNNVRVIILGQDPYPSSRFATGIAFSVPENVHDYPPTLQNIFKEYMDDLHYPVPECGCLIPWCEQGVLLWNVYPSVSQGFTHWWPEWELLTTEILSLCPDTVVVALGSKAREQTLGLDDRYEVLCWSHPSPRGAGRGNSPFLGSRMFSTINSALVGVLGKEPINWRI